MALILVFLLLLIGILRVFYQKKFLTCLLMHLLAEDLAIKLLEKKMHLLIGTSVVLTCIFFLSVALFFYLTGSNINYHNLIGNSDFQQFLIILLVQRFLFTENDCKQNWGIYF